MAVCRQERERRVKVLVGSREFMGRHKKKVMAMHQI